MSDDREDRRATRQCDARPMRGPVVGEVDAIDVRPGKGLPDEQAVAVLRPACPAADRAVVALTGRPEKAVLLHHVDDLLEAEQVGLERRHVREQERQPLEPAIGEVPDVEGRDVQTVHRAPSRGIAGQPSVVAATGNENENVLPDPSTNSTQMRPPCCSMMWRAIASPSPVPPAAPRTRARSTL